MANNKTGTVTYPNGNHTYDEWQNNSAHGKGTATFQMEKYRDFQDGKHHGTGTMTYSNGNSTTENGKIMHPKEQEL